MDIITLYTKTIKALVLTSFFLSVFSFSTTSFSDPDINTIKSVVRELGSDAYNGRASYTFEGRVARDTLVEKLIDLDVSPAGSAPSTPFTGYLQSFQDASGTLSSIIGIYYPPGTEGQPPSILLSAHYDGITSGGSFGRCDRIDNDLYQVPRPGFSGVCNAAVDNLTGVASILAIIDDVASRLTSPVAIIFFDGEEPGLIGSEYFAANPTFPTNKLQLHITLESIGYNSFEGMEDHLNVLGAHSGGSNLRGDVDAAFALTTLDMQHTHYAVAQGATDIHPFIENWNVPYLILSNGRVATYHSSADQFLDKPRDPVNMNKVHQAAIAVANIVELVSGSDRNYSYTDLNYAPNGFIQPPYSVNQDLLDYIDKARSGLHFWTDREVRAELGGLRDRVRANMGFFARYRWDSNYEARFDLVNSITQDLFRTSRLYTLEKIDEGEYANQ